MKTFTQRLLCDSTACMRTIITQLKHRSGSLEFIWTQRQHN